MGDRNVNIFSHRLFAAIMAFIFSVFCWLTGRGALDDQAAQRAAERMRQATSTPTVDSSRWVLTRRGCTGTVIRNVDHLFCCTYSLLPEPHNERRLSMFRYEKGSVATNFFDTHFYFIPSFHSPIDEPSGHGSEPLSFLDSFGSDAVGGGAADGSFLSALRPHVTVSATPVSGGGAGLGSMSADVAPPSAATSRAPPVTHSTPVPPPSQTSVAARQILSGTSAGAANGFQQLQRRQRWPWTVEVAGANAAPPSPAQARDITDGGRTRRTSQEAATSFLLASPTFISEPRAFYSRGPDSVTRRGLSER